VTEDTAMCCLAERIAVRGCAVRSGGRVQGGSRPSGAESEGHPRL